jgi:hypothetical protein
MNKYNFLVLILNMINIDWHKPHKQKYVSVLNNFKAIKVFWNQTTWQPLNHTNMDSQEVSKLSSF